MAAGDSILCSATLTGSNIPITTVMAVSQGLGAPSVGVAGPGGTSGVGGVPAGAPGPILVLSTTVTPASSGSGILESWGALVFLMLALGMLIIAY